MHLQVVHHCAVMLKPLVFFCQRFQFLIEEALENLLSTFEELPHGRSGTHNMVTPIGSLQSRAIFDGTNTLPKEVMLETTLKVFDYNYDFFEVCFNKVQFYHHY